jgi:hypothetical protein
MKVPFPCYIGSISSRGSIHFAVLCQTQDHLCMTTIKFQIARFEQGDFLRPCVRYVLNSNTMLTQILCFVLLWICSSHNACSNLCSIGIMPSLSRNCKHDLRSRIASSTICLGFRGRLSLRGGHDSAPVQPLSDQPEIEVEESVTVLLSNRCMISFVRKIFSHSYVAGWRGIPGRRECFATF